MDQGHGGGLCLRGHFFLKSPSCPQSKLACNLWPDPGEVTCDRRTIPKWQPRNTWQSLCKAKRSFTFEEGCSYRPESHRQSLARLAVHTCYIPGRITCPSWGLFRAWVHNTLWQAIVCGRGKVFQSNDITQFSERVFGHDFHLREKVISQGPLQIWDGGWHFTHKLHSVTEWFFNFPPRKRTEVAILWFNERPITHGFRNMKLKNSDYVLARLQKRQVKQYEIKTTIADSLPIFTNRWNGFSKEGRASTGVVIKAYFNVSKECISSDSQLTNHLHTRVIHLGVIKVSNSWPRSCPNKLRDTG
jgi:hypothetical protein